jgi:opacity protein-like surface antigen
MSVAERTSSRTLLKPSPAALYFWTCGLLLCAPPPGFAQTDDPGEPHSPVEATEPKLDFYLSPPLYTFGLRAGWVWNRSDSEVQKFLTGLLTLDRSDFNGPVISIDLARRILPSLDVVFGIEVSTQETDSSYRDYVDSVTGAEIEQTTRLTQVPLTFSLRIFPLTRERKVAEHAYIPNRFAPYLGGGIGATWYELKQKGEFVDFRDDSIFESKFTSDGFGFSGHVFVGGEFLLTRSISLALEGRYQWASSNLNTSFVGFDPIDLDGVRIEVGFHFRL